MRIENAKYQTGPMPDDDENVGIFANIDGHPSFVPISEDNYHYREIKRQADAGIITIADAD
jgi:hypothetical protein